MPPALTYYSVKHVYAQKNVDMSKLTKFRICQAKTCQMSPPSISGYWHHGKLGGNLGKDYSLYLHCSRQNRA